MRRDPGREALPGSGAAERIAALLNDDHEKRRPDRDPLNFGCGPPVVRDYQQQKRREADEVDERKREGIKDRPAVETGVEKRERREEHQALVRRRMETIAIAEVNERGEQEHVGALARVQLGRAYAAAGDKDKARAAYADFFTLWKDADRDIPVLKEAQREYARVK